LLNIRKIGLKRFFKGLVGFIGVLGFFIFYEFILPLNLTGNPNKTYEHFLSRGEGLNFAFNIRALILGYVHNYSIFFVIALFGSAIILFLFYLKKKEKFPPVFFRIILLFLIHFSIWMFLVKNECGHLMNHFLVPMLIIGFGFQILWDYLKNQKRYLKKILITVSVILLLLNSYHTFMLFNSLSLEKEKYPLYFTPYRVPCGYLEGRKIGIKSVSYLLRPKLNPNEILVSDKGVAFNFLYMGQGFTNVSSLHAIELLISGADIYKSYNVRFIGIEPSNLSLGYVRDFDKMGYNKLIVKEGDSQIYFVYDILKKGQVEEIDRDQYDRQYYTEYASDVLTAIPYYLYY